MQSHISPMPFSSQESSVASPPIYSLLSIKILTSNLLLCITLYKMIHDYPLTSSA